MQLWGLIEIVHKHTITKRRCGVADLQNQYEYMILIEGRARYYTNVSRFFILFKSLVQPPEQNVCMCSHAHTIEIKGNIYYIVLYPSTHTQKTNTRTHTHDNNKSEAHDNDDDHLLGASTHTHTAAATAEPNSIEDRAIAIARLATAYKWQRRPSVPYVPSVP